MINSNTLNYNQPVPMQTDSHYDQASIENKKLCSIYSDASKVLPAITETTYDKQSKGKEFFSISHKHLSAEELFIAQEPITKKKTTRLDAATPDKQDDYNKNISDNMVTKEKAEYTSACLLKHIEQLTPYFYSKFIPDQSTTHTHTSSKKFITSFIKDITRFKENDVSKAFEIFKNTKEYKECVPVCDEIVNNIKDTISEIIKIDNILIEMSSTLANDSLTKGFPTNQIYKLFIDKKDWSLDSHIYTYENELGFANGMLTAWTKMSNILSKGPLDLGKITELNEICMHNIRYLDIEEREAVKLPSMMASVDVAYGSNATILGVQEILCLANNSGVPLVDTYYNDLDENNIAIPGEFKRSFYELFKDGKLENGLIQPSKKIRMCTSKRFFDYGKSDDKMIEVVEKYCENYENELKKIKEDTDLTEQERGEKIIYEIVRVCRNIQFSHPFTDGNSRTCTGILFNGLLLKERLSPAIIEDINVFDGFDIRSLVIMTKAGQKDFQEHRRHSLA